jgi:hypothetical protein
VALQKCGEDLAAAAGTWPWGSLRWQRMVVVLNLPQILFTIDDDFPERLFLQAHQLSWRNGTKTL